MKPPRHTRSSTAPNSRRANSEVLVGNEDLTSPSFVIGRERPAVREEENAAVRRLTHRADWFHVERDMPLFEIRALALKREGWIER
jgi:hypothetical protein